MLKPFLSFLDKHAPSERNCLGALVQLVPLDEIVQDIIEAIQQVEPVVEVTAWERPVGGEVKQDLGEPVKWGLIGAAIVFNEEGTLQASEKKKSAGSATMADKTMIKTRKGRKEKREWHG